MRKTSVVATGLLCLVSAWARAQGFEQQVLQISRGALGAAREVRQAAAASEAQDALDEAKVGVAATFIHIKPGEFEMGSSQDEPGRLGDELRHHVALTKGFELQATAVTQLQYFLVTGRNPSYYKERKNCDAGNFKVLSGAGLCVNHPVENVSSEDARAFIVRLNEIQNRYTYRLPTEAEWEYAARAGRSSDFPYSFGFNDTNELQYYAWYDWNSGGRTHAVATRKANSWGLYDINGNVWQWVDDWYGVYPSSPAQNPAGPATGSDRVLRGGSCYSGAGRLRAAFRSGGYPASFWRGVGFRLARMEIK